MDLDQGKKAQVVYNACRGVCDSGGCTSHIVVDDRVYEVFGSRPLVLEGVGISAIGWFGKYGDCNGIAGYESCLYAMYWQKTAGADGTGMLMYSGGEDVTDQYR